MLKKIADKIKNLDKKKIQFVVAFGSYLTDRYDKKKSDIDIAIYYDGTKPERFNFRALASGMLNDKYDIQIFQDLPLHIRKEVMDRGKLLYSKDMKRTIQIYIEQNEEYERIEKYIDLYFQKVGEVA